MHIVSDQCKHCTFKELGSKPSPSSDKVSSVKYDTSTGKVYAELGSCGTDPAASCFPSPASYSSTPQQYFSPTSATSPVGGGYQFNPYDR